VSNNIFYYRGPGRTIWKQRFNYTSSRISGEVIPNIGLPAPATDNINDWFFNQRDIAAINDRSNVNLKR